MFEQVPRENEIKIQNKEDIFFQKLSMLPDELASKWENEYYELTDSENPDFFERFDTYLEERSEILVSSLKFAPGTSPELIGEIKQRLEDVRKNYGNIKDFLGEGRTAKVYVDPQNSNICVKYIKDVAEYTKTDIPLYLEYMRLFDLQNFQSHGIRTPSPLFENTNGEHMYGMERISGNTLVQIMEKPNDNIDLVKLAKTLDREAVSDNLVGYVKEMHDKFKITHNDLEVINIMLDNDGNFYIIDFGKSKREEIGEDHELYREKDIKTVKSAIQEFFNKIDRIEID